MHGARPTIGDVARAAGVSKGTVSLAYSGKRPVAEETRRRVFAAAESLRWTASSSAQALATSRTSTIGLVIARRPEIIATDTFFPRFIAGCEAVLAEAGMGLMLNVVTDEDAETAAYERYAAGRVDGVILLDVKQGDRRPDLVRELGLTAVMLTAEAPHEDDPVDTPWSTPRTPPPSASSWTCSWVPATPPSRTSPGPCATSTPRRAGTPSWTR